MMKTIIKEAKNIIVIKQMITRYIVVENRYISRIARIHSELSSP